jgi:hypothetical protein
MPTATSDVGCYVPNFCHDGSSYMIILLRFMDIVHCLVFCRMTVFLKLDLLERKILVPFPVPLLFQTEYSVSESQYISILR